MKRYIIIAGETSGDTYGASIMRELKQKSSDDIFFWGIGGKKMIDQGLFELDDMRQISVVGFTEIFKRLPSIIKLLNRIVIFAHEIEPAGIILIDFPGFNLSLAKKINKQFPITYFISPQIWAWNKKRLKVIKKYINKMLVIFPFEEDLYKKNNVDATYLGHPFLDEWQPSNSLDLKSNFGFNSTKKLIGIFPGSRDEEISRHLPIYIDAINKLKRLETNYEFALGLAPGFSKKDMSKKYNLDGIKIVQSRSLLLLECSDVAIVTSGTISLQATFMNTPCVVSYRLSFLSWIISKFLIKVKYISMTNIMSNKMVIPELVQFNVTSNNIVSHVESLLVDKKIKENLKEINLMFKNKKDCLKNASQIIKDAIDQ